MLQLSSLTDLPSNIPASSVLVPTMGALHEGHAALIRAAREIAGASGSVVVSIFLNPLQFDRPGDLADYPASLEEDLALCRSLDVNVVFTPSPAEFYATDHSVRVSENLLSRNLCGAARPGHFEGVCTVVLKLFHALLPSAAVLFAVPEG